MGALLVASMAVAQSKRPPQPPTSSGVQPSPVSERAQGPRYSGHLMIGDAGPDFTLPLASGAPFRLQDLRSREGAALVFLQRADAYLAGFAPTADSLSGQGVRLVFLCQQRTSKETQALRQLAVVHDRQGDVARVYGSLNVITGDTVPAVYLLDKTGKLRYYAVGRLPAPAELQAIAVAVLAPPFAE